MKFIYAFIEHYPSLQVIVKFMKDWASQVAEAYNSLSPDVRPGLAHAPVHGEGLHDWLVPMAIKLWQAISDQEIIITILRAYTYGNRTSQSELDREIRDAVNNSRRYRSGGQSLNYATSSPSIQLNVPE